MVPFYTGIAVQIRKRIFSVSVSYSLLFHFIMLT
uniref:Uncharacterized protein n=1 Tax=Anguilla anguilla TaxID=7936 RepID=A0A0E9S5G3_ANGAN